MKGSDYSIEKLDEYVQQNSQRFYKPLPLPVFSHPEPIPNPKSSIVQFVRVNFFFSQEEKKAWQIEQRKIRNEIEAKNRANQKSAQEAHKLELSKVAANNKIAESKAKKKAKAEFLEKYKQFVSQCASSLELSSFEQLVEIGNYHDAYYASKKVEKVLKQLRKDAQQFFTNPGDSVALNEVSQKYRRVRNKALSDHDCASLWQEMSHNEKIRKAVAMIAEAVDEMAEAAEDHALAAERLADASEDAAKYERQIAIAEHRQADIKEIEFFLDRIIGSKSKDKNKSL